MPRRRPRWRPSGARAILTRAAPDDVPKWLDKFFRASIEEKDCVPALEQLIAECRLPENMLGQFRQRLVHAFIRTWQVIGPFPNPEDNGLNSQRDRIDLERFLGHDRAGRRRPSDR